MTNNYVGPGWYWVEGVDSPCYVERYGDGSIRARLVAMAFAVYPESITHIPRPAQRPVVDWSVMPAWAKWVAMDEDGHWCWFSERPSFVEGGVRWFLNSHKVSSRDFGLLPYDYLPTYTGDWKNSLVGRPE